MELMDISKEVKTKFITPNNGSYVVANLPLQVKLTDILHKRGADRLHLPSSKQYSKLTLMLVIHHEHRHYATHPRSK
jgi:hypothetical protein